MTIQRLRRLATGFALWVMLALAAAPSALAQVSSQINPADGAAIDLLASQLSGGRARFDAVLAEMQFPKAEAEKRWPGFSKWPALRQIETAYFSAVEAGGATAGERFIETMGRIAVEDWSAAMARDPVMRPYVDGKPKTTAAERVAVKFKLPATVPTALPPPEVRAAVAALETYLGKPPGGVTRLLTGCCGLLPEVAYQVQRESGSVAEALTKALLQGGVPPELRERILRSVSLVADGAGSIAYDRALQPYLAELNARDGTGAFIQAATAPRAQVTEGTLAQRRTLNAAAREVLPTLATRLSLPAATRRDVLAELASYDKPEPPKPTEGGAGSGGGEGPGGGGGSSSGAAAGGSGGGGGGGWNAERNAQRQAAIERSIGPSSSAGGPRGRPSFGGARVSVRGWGGVLFGNTVTSKLPKPRALFWSPEPAVAGREAWGRLDVELSDGRIVFSRRMRAEDVWLATSIVAGGDGRAPLDVKGGEAVGLAGFVSGDMFAVHPAIYGYGLADAAILSDARAFRAPDQTRELISTKSSASKASKAAALDWLSKEWGYYKITDAPLEIVVRDDMLVAERTPLAGYDAPLRRIAFLSFLGFDTHGTSRTEDDTPLDESATPFYPAVPALISAVPEFARLNSFAETLAITRWAAAEGATLPKVTPRPRRSAQGLMVVPQPDGSLKLADPTAHFAAELAKCLKETQSQPLMGTLCRTGVGLEWVTQTGAFDTYVRERSQAGSAP